MKHLKKTKSVAALKYNITLIDDGLKRAKEQKRLFKTKIITSDDTLGKLNLKLKKLKKKRTEDFDRHVDSTSDDQFNLELVKLNYMDSNLNITAKD